METSGKVRQSQPFWLKFWMFFRWMFLAIAVAAVLFSLAFFVFTGIWQWIFGGAPLSSCSVLVYGATHSAARCTAGALR